jgi:membrane protease YdiL (CAAX protease family)
MTTEGNLSSVVSSEASTSSGHFSKPRSRAGTSSTFEGGTPLSYADVGLFFVFVFLLASLFRFGVHFHILDQATVDKPPLFLQTAISLSLVAALYCIIRIRHGSRVWALLGWNRPGSFYLAVAFAGGVGIAVVVDFIAHATTPANHLIRFWDLLILDVLLGPVVEESFFRGCLLPVLARKIGPVIATLATASVFATFHPVRTLTQWACFACTGVAYGWIRIKSGSTASSTFMHAAYNATLYIYQIL